MLETLVVLLNLNSVGVYFLFQGISIDTEEFGSLHLVAVVFSQRKLNERLLNLLNDDSVQTMSSTSACLCWSNKSESLLLTRFSRLVDCRFVTYKGSR